MRVLAVAFTDSKTARAVLADLRERYDLTPDDAALATLAEDASVDRRDARSLLAGRFRDERVPEVRSLVARAGGQVLVEVEEQWTKPWPAASEDRQRYLP